MPPMPQLQLDAPTVHHIAGWERMTDAGRLAILRRMAEEGSRDPRIRSLTAQILAAAGVQQRDYAKQAAVLLAWVQSNIAYLNEPGEVLQTPLYTLKVAHGDCDDMAILLAAMLGAIALPWRFVLSGKGADGAKTRWVEGTPYPRGLQAVHIYLTIGNVPFRPTSWVWAEPTIRGVPLGWDVLSAGQVSRLPEMGGVLGVDVAAAAAGRAGALGILADLNWQSIVASVITGVLTTIAADAAITAIKGRRG